MAAYITIDGGTTNTRISLVSDGRIQKTIKISVGARAGINNKALLENEIKKGIEHIISKTGITPVKILASGMITSEFGLHNIPHISTPAGIEELHNTMCEVVLSHISEFPFVFVRGVRTEGDSIENADMMRGEETELMGILTEGEGVYILPGSHSKIIYTNKFGKITDFSTMLTGEMLEALKNNTILKDAVIFEGSEIDDKYLFKGFNYCEHSSLNEALFRLRILKNIFGADQNKIYSFYMGAVLHGEVKSIIKKAPPKIIIGGKKQIKQAIAMLLKSFTDSEITILSDFCVEESTALGMVKIFEYSGKKMNRA